MLRARVAIEEAMRSLDALIKSKRGTLTTSQIMDEQRTYVVGGETFVNGRLEANEYWEFVGSGRGPGGLPPIQRIQDWLDRAGLEISAWAIGKTIQEKGTKAWREKRPNTYLESIEEWQTSAAFRLVQQVAADELAETSVDIIRKNIKPN